MLNQSKKHQPTHLEIRESIKSEYNRLSFIYNFLTYEAGGQPNPNSDTEKPKSS